MHNWKNIMQNQISCNHVNLAVSLIAIATDNDLSAKLD